MNREKRFLVAVDNSDASKRSVTYVSRVLADRDDVCIRLFNILPHLPPALLEWGGTAEPETEQEFLAREKSRFIEQARVKARPTMEYLLSLLAEAGIPEQAIETQFFPSVATVDLVDDILEVARSEEFATIVVGRESWSWVKERFRHHYCSELIRHAQGLTVWAVE